MVCQTYAGVSGLVRRIGLVMVVSRDAGVKMCFRAIPCAVVGLVGWGRALAG